ncbi:MAG: DM13 domain-containing protein [Parcubacteria group bacterium]
MKKILIIIVVTIILVVAYWLISPLFIERAIDESLEDITQEETIETQIVSQGTFEGLERHNGEGTASLIKIGDKHYIRFEDDFRVTNGPDLFVHFGKDGEYVAEARLGDLKGNVGGQNYEVPENLDPNSYNEVWIWCRAFSTPFAKAVLN